MPGMTIRVRLTERLSSSQSEKGEPFHAQVASDVLQNGRVMIPAGSGIEGRVTYASAGQHLGGHGSIRLKPEAVILPDGSRVELHAETTGTPGSHTRVGGEGTINPGSRAKRDGIEYSAVVGTGVIAGAVIGVVAAFFLREIMASLIYGLSANDPLILSIVPLVIVLVVLLACYLPARRATKVDPMVALRYE